jgi:hypothetical protein
MQVHSTTDPHVPSSESNPNDHDPFRLPSFSASASIIIAMILVAELLEEYTALVSRVVEQLLNDAPFPRRMRFLVLRSLPFVPPPPHALRVTTRARGAQADLITP